MEDEPRERWFLLADDVLAEVLERVRNGEDPDLVTAELWANASVIEDDDERIDRTDDLGTNGICVYSFDPRKTDEDDA